MEKKKMMIGGIVLLIAAAIAWFILLRPESISQETAKASFSAHEAACGTVAEYLTANKVSAEITGFFTLDENYGVPMVGNDDAYRDFVESVEELLSRDFSRIISDGSTVEFVYPSTGGKLTARYASVIYNGKTVVDGKSTTELNRNGWHLYIADSAAES